MRLNTSHQHSLFTVPNNRIVEVDETSLWSDWSKVIGHFPNEHVELLPGLKWGVCYQLYTPAFWKLQYLMNSFSIERDVHQLGGNIIEEVVLCILGGYGIPSEMGNLAFERLRDRNLIS
ncbi:MAG: hypothetical protein EOP48_17645, partial [Sphingobacteriales bacterium]